MHIAIVIPAFNVAAFLPDAIRSLVGQTHANWSAIVVDDGSTDLTAEVAACFSDTRIAVIRQRNAGVSAARNVGANAVIGRADAVLFLDSDDWLAPDALCHLAEALEAAPAAVASIGCFAWIGADGIRRLAPRPPQGELLERLLIRNLFANGGHVLIRRDAVEAVGDFRTDLSYGEDWEYWTRLAMLGAFKAVSSPAPLLFVRERLDGAYLSHATDPDAYRPALAAIYRNPGLPGRLGAKRLALLAGRAEAEMAWTVGRELIRHGRHRDGLRWLGRSIQGAPSAKRLALLGLSRLRLGPFRPYPTAGIGT